MAYFLLNLYAFFVAIVLYCIADSHDRVEYKAITSKKHHYINVMAGEHMCIANLFLNNIIKMVNFLLNGCWLDENARSLDTE
jgi:hypothetical protein